MSDFRSTTWLIRNQIAYQVKVFFRTPVAAFFTLILPLIMLILFNALFGDNSVDLEDGSYSAQQFYTGGLAAFAAVSATYTNLANTVPILRDEGILKRWRGTPLNPSVYIAGMIGMAVIVAIVGVVVMVGVGVTLYDVELEAAKLPAAIVTFVVGVAAFAALGLACAALVPNARSAPAAANATILPLAFVSNVFIALEDPPRWLEIVATSSRSSRSSRPSRTRSSRSWTHRRSRGVAWATSLCGVLPVPWWHNGSSRGSPAVGGKSESGRRSRRRGADA